MTLAADLQLKLYRDMWTVRSFEFGLEREFKKGNVPGMLHTGVGQEAVQAAIAANLRRTDAFFPDHRCHGLLVLAGTPGQKIMAELFGKATGVCSGKGGSLHSADPAAGNFGDNAVEGSMMTTALGVALGFQMQRRDDLAAVIVGDGTAGRGEWHESLNLAATWQLPVLYCCVNNGYAISTAVGASHATENLYEFAQAYKMPAVQVDGNDIDAAYEATRAAVESIRAGQGPYFVEYKTWRWQGIFSGEFRPAEEVRYWKEEHDPLKLARTHLLTTGLADEATLDRIKAEVDAEVEQWITFALESPPPDPAKATANVYVGWEVEPR
ncbi:MAG TPA: thiamine pyrophosphate-dependent dehydrogenase E1 component subunit alpha [Anaerolineae bacterium]|nr:thiamine pyrophosphate-dependent dehydrogenase E1 component subunit alpha [Anaerolineae bacterium]HMR66842.1 thiamine pyrophosphate-dependent dehydrogenase E1 component subunit alpha [Anaerolineae bacterium]